MTTNNEIENTYSKGNKEIPMRKISLWNLEYEMKKIGHTTTKVKRKRSR
jgi:hypothetical protein